MFWSKLCKSTWNCAWNFAFPVFISPIVWNMCENLRYESVELHNEQECYWATINRAGTALVSTITSLKKKKKEKLTTNGSPDDDRIVSHDAPLFMLYHCVRDISWSVFYSTREMNIAVLEVDGFQTCFGSAASAFANIELAYIDGALKENFYVNLKGFARMCFTDLSRTTCALGRN